MKSVSGTLYKNCTDGNEHSNSNDLKSQLTPLNDEADLTDDGRLFQTHAAATRNAYLNARDPHTENRHIYIAP